MKVYIPTEYFKHAGYIAKPEASETQSQVNRDRPASAVKNK
jgi:hypothetical protein